LLAPGVGAADTLAGHHAELRIASAKRFEQAQDVLRIVLTIAVHRHHNVTPCGSETGAQRRALAEIAVVLNHPEHRKAIAKLEELADGVVPRSVIDEEDLKGCRIARLERLADL